MPLIIVTGLPTSGKTTRAKQLQDYLLTRIADTKYKLHYFSDDTLSISRAVYDLSPEKPLAHTRSANASEKDARAAIYGAVKRVLSDKDIIILDGLNYIKGWRYQLHCEAKAVSTPSCILQIGIAKDKAQEINEERQRRKQTGEASDGDVEAYEPANWENLAFRYEEPNPMTRWDSPLFALVWDDTETRAKEVFNSVWEAIAGDGRIKVKPNQSTQQRGRDSEGDYLYILERETQDVIKKILDQQGHEGGGEIKIALHGEGKEPLVLELPAGRKVGLPQMQRLRRAFVGLNRGGIGLESVGNMNSDGIRETFVRYLNDTFEKDT